jgi:hypothetical protein
MTFEFLIFYVLIILVLCTVVSQFLKGFFSTSDFQVCNKHLLCLFSF